LSFVPLKNVIFYLDFHYFYFYIREHKWKRENVDTRSLINIFFHRNIFLSLVVSWNLDLELNEILGNFWIERMNVDTLVENIIKNEQKTTKNGPKGTIALAQFGASDIV